MIKSEDSMLEWFPKIKDLPIRQPRTVFVFPTKEEMSKLRNEMFPHSFTDRVAEIIENGFDLPVFLRTDLASGKHAWKNSCFYDGSNKLWRHIYEVVVFNLIADFAGLPFVCLAIREFIPMDTHFTAFSDMPINPERRYFVKDGQVVCHHPYWIPEAIEMSHKPASIENWQEVLEQINTEDATEIKMLSGISEKVSQCVPGFWSVDYCKAREPKGSWVLIDMATARKSWHPEDCKKLED